MREAGALAKPNMHMMCWDHSAPSAFLDLQHCAAAAGHLPRSHHRRRDRRYRRPTCRGCRISRAPGGRRQGAMSGRVGLVYTPSVERRHSQFDHTHQSTLPCLTNRPRSIGWARSSSCGRAWGMKGPTCSKHAGLPTTFSTLPQCSAFARQHPPCMCLTQQLHPCRRAILSGLQAAVESARRQPLFSSGPLQLRSNPLTLTFRSSGAWHSSACSCGPCQPHTASTSAEIAWQGKWGAW